MKNHPASSIHEGQAAEAFTLSITGRGPHWDKTMSDIHPQMADSGSENLWYVIDNCIEQNICRSEPKTGSQEEYDVLSKWCKKRAKTCKQKMHRIEINDGRILAHRIINSKPESLRSSLGVFWSHDFNNWVDPTSPWGGIPGSMPTLLIEALVPVEAVDWQTSCMALMDWMVGDTESELRLKPGYPLKNVKAKFLSNRQKISIPDVKYIS